VKNLQRYLSEIITALRTLDPYKIILFGSLSQKNHQEANDIDIAVILNSDETPKTFEERMAMRIKVRNQIYEISERVPIDLIVYTKKEYFSLIEMKQPFIKEINAGQILYDKASLRLDRICKIRSSYH
jgi:predicted nucleotidyltransferase